MKELYAIDKSTLEAIANAIRAKKGTTEPIPVSSLASEIESICVGPELTIRAGTYDMVDFAYGAENLNWGTQNFEGILNDDFSLARNMPFSRIEAYDEWTLLFLSDTGASVEIIPSWNSSLVTNITTEKDQEVSERFKEWFDACFKLRA